MCVTAVKAFPHQMVGKDRQQRGCIPHPWTKSVFSAEAKQAGEKNAKWIKSEWGSTVKSNGCYVLHRIAYREQSVKENMQYASNPRNVGTAMSFTINLGVQVSFCFF